jgi:hypothetical protein
MFVYLDTVEPGDGGLLLVHGSHKATLERKDTSILPLPVRSGCILTGCLYFDSNDRAARARWDVRLWELADR